MFVKQVTETELNEYERVLEGTCNSIAQLAGSDEDARAQVVATVDACRDLQVLIQTQIAGFHPVEPLPSPQDPD